MKREFIDFMFESNPSTDDGAVKVNVISILDLMDESSKGIEQYIDNTFGITK